MMAAESWIGFDANRALAWATVFLEHSPGSTRMVFRSFAVQALAQGRPPMLRGWLERAHAAEAIGLSPERYLLLHDELRRIDPAEHASHPHHRRILREAHTVAEPFDPEIWAEWPARIEAGASVEDATRLLLRRADPTFPAPSPPGDRLHGARRGEAPSEHLRARAEAEFAAMQWRARRNGAF